MIVLNHADNVVPPDVSRLACFILEHYASEIGYGDLAQEGELINRESSIDVAIRLLKQYKAALEWQSGRLSTTDGFADRSPEDTIHEALDWGKANVRFGGCKSFQMTEFIRLQELRQLRKGGYDGNQEGRSDSGPASSPTA